MMMMMIIIIIIIIWNWLTLVTPQALETIHRKFATLWYGVSFPHTRRSVVLLTLFKLFFRPFATEKHKIDAARFTNFFVLNLFHLPRALLRQEFPLETSETSRRFTSVHRSKLVPHPTLQESHYDKFSLQWTVCLQQTNCIPAQIIYCSTIRRSMNYLNICFMCHVLLSCVICLLCCVVSVIGHVTATDSAP